MARIAVIDIGKTNAKLLVVDPSKGIEEIVARVPNRVLSAVPYPHFDTEGLWRFILEGLGRVGAVDAVTVTTHGASAALVDAHGGLALPVLDYEHDGPDLIAGEYDAIRPEFTETGSPRLPMGLNLGAQLYWQAKTFPDRFAHVRHILTLPQYWGFRLSGVAASEYTSLGCHTDLWNPFEGRFSSLLARLGWQSLFPEVSGPAKVLGPLRADVAAATGLPRDTPVISGIHDSNASLMPWLAGDAPRAVLSTGTWMIVMALRGRRGMIDPSRDLLVNVNALGEPVPTARFMAGREIEEIMDGQIVSPGDDEVAGVLARGIMALPSRHPTTGPFQGLRFAWTPEAPATPGMRMAAASLYAALMGAECLELIGAEGEIVVEGPFGANRIFLRMLATATGRRVLAAGSGAGTGLGAALLAAPGGARAPAPVIEPDTADLWRGYASAWRARVATAWAGQRR